MNFKPNSTEKPFTNKKILKIDCLHNEFNMKYVFQEMLWKKHFIANPHLTKAGSTFISSRNTIGSLMKTCLHKPIETWEVSKMCNIISKYFCISNNAQPASWAAHITRGFFWFFSYSHYSSYFLLEPTCPKFSSFTWWTWYIGCICTRANLR